MARSLLKNLCVGLASLLLAGCSPRMFVVISNHTSEALLVDLRVADDEGDYCPLSGRVSFIPVPDLDRRWRSPRRTPAAGVKRSATDCTIYGRVPASTALELEVWLGDPSRWVESGLSPTLHLEGPATSITLKGAQVGAFFEPRGFTHVLHYSG